MNDQAATSTQPAPPDFFVTGGTVHRDAACYVVRRADGELYENLRAGHFCYVLTSRQMGKSSLMVRTAIRLRENGTAVAVLDLTSVGSNLDAEQWYGGLLMQIGLRLEMEDALLEYWESHAHFGPMQRWMQAMRDCVLPRDSSRIVIFIDEVDAVRSLPFSTDEFFAGIRELYNRRSEDPELERLTFCLLGVALPSDLIRDSRLTPFNIGKRIELPDFQAAEAAPLATGLGRGAQLSAQLLDRVLHWTGGHPYLTQRLCQGVAESGAVNDRDVVDRVCGNIFLAERARERDDNLLFVRERILRGDQELAGLLNLYARVRQGKPVADDETSPLVSLLRLAGIVRSEAGRLRVRNRIYERVFDRNWIADNMPDAEVRRQRAAYRRGLFRAAAAAAVIIALITMLLVYALWQRSLAEAARAEAFSRELAANAIGQLPADPELSALLAIEAWKAAPTTQAAYALRQSLPEPHAGPALRGHASAVRHAQFSPDGKRVVTASLDQSARVWDTTTGRLTADLRGHTGIVHTASFSPNGKTVLTASSDRTAALWDALTGRRLIQFRGHMAPVTSAAFSPDGRQVVTSSDDRTARIWDAGTGTELTVLRGHQDVVWNGAFSPDGRLVATASNDQTARLWQAASGRMLFTLKGHTADVGVVFSPDGSLAATWSSDQSTCIWETRTGRRRATLRGHTNWMHSAAFSPDGRLLVTGSYDGTARVWETGAGRGLLELRGHTSAVWSAEFSPDGKWIVTASNDATARVWDANTGRLLKELRGHTKGMQCAARFSPDGTMALTGSNDGTARLWHLQRSNVLTELRGHTAPVISMAFSPNGRSIVTTSHLADHSTRIWDLQTGREIRKFEDPIIGLRSVAFHPDAQWVAITNAYRTLFFWEVDTGRLAKTFQGFTDNVLSSAFSPDGKEILTGGYAGSVQLWRVDNGQEIRRFSGRDETAGGMPSDGEHADRVADVAFSADGGLVAAAGWNGLARIWETGTGRELAVLRGHQNQVFSVAFSRDGKWIVTGGADATARVWERGTWRIARELAGHKTAVNSVEFSPDGRFVVSASADGTVLVWEPLSGQIVSQLPRQSEPVSSAIFSPDGKSLAAACDGNIVRIYACEACLPVSEIVALMGTRISRQLTPDERARYLHESPSQ
jgi:WD40 repeat protein